MSSRSRPTRPILISVAAALLAVVVCAVLGAVAASARPATYTATSQILYGDPATALVSGAGQDSDAAVARTLSAQAQVITGDAVMRAAAVSLKLKQKTLVDATTVDVMVDSNVVDIAVSGPTAAEALRRATGVTAAYEHEDRSASRSSYRRLTNALNTPIGALRIEVASAMKAGRPGNGSALQSSLATLVQQQSQLAAAAAADDGNVQVLTAPILPTGTSSVSALTGAIVGAAIGLVLAVGLILLLDWWRRREPVRVVD